MSNGSGPNMEIVRLVAQSVVAIGVLTGATFLAVSNHITSDAVVGLYGAAIGAVGAGAAVARQGTIGAHSHHVQDDHTTSTEKP